MASFSWTPSETTTDPEQKTKYGISTREKNAKRSSNVSYYHQVCVLKLEEGIMGPARQFSRQRWHAGSLQRYEGKIPAKMLKQKLDKNMPKKLIFLQMYHYHRRLPIEKILGYSQPFILRDSKISNILIKDFFLSWASLLKCSTVLHLINHFYYSFWSLNTFFPQSQEAKWYFLVLLDV